MKQKIKERKGKAVKFVEKTVPMAATVSFDIKQVQPEACFPKMIIPESMWCFPKNWHYKNQLRDMKARYPEFKAKAKKLQEYLWETMSEDIQYRKFAEALLGETISSFSTVKNEEIPKDSLITSVFKGDDFIEGFLEDVTRQTVWDKCELIFVDGASPGSEATIIKKYQEKYPDQIKYKRLEQDPGIYGCWNEGLSMATGEFITNANLDDRKRLDSLERHAKELLSNQDVDLVYADSYITEDPQKKFENMVPSDKKYNFEQFTPEAMLRGNQAHNNPMWRKTLHDKVGLFNPEFKSAGDWEFFLRCVFDGNAKFKKINDLLGLYYRNPTGMSTNPANTEWKQKEEMRIFQNYRKKYVEKKKEQTT